MSRHKDYFSWSVPYYRSFESYIYLCCRHTCPNQLIDSQHVKSWKWFATNHWQIEGCKSAEKLKQAEIFDYKKRLTEAEIRYQQQQSLLDSVRAEQNLCSKSLIETQEEVRELKSKLKITDQQIEQLKEDVATKEASLIKKEFCKLRKFKVLEYSMFVLIALLNARLFPKLF